MCIHRGGVFALTHGSGEIAGPENVDRPLENDCGNGSIQFDDLEELNIENLCLSRDLPLQMELVIQKHIPHPIPFARKHVVKTKVDEMESLASPTPFG